MDGQENSFKNVFGQLNHRGTKCGAETVSLWNPYMASGEGSIEHIHNRFWQIYSGGSVRDNNHRKGYRIKNGVL